MSFNSSSGGNKTYYCKDGHPNTFDPYKVYVYLGKKFMYCEQCGKRIDV